MCTGTFTGPTLTAYTGFTAEYNLDNAGWTTTPVTTGVTGCHTIKARYVLTAACGTIAAGTPSADAACGESNEVEFVIYPAAPVISASSMCTGTFTGPTLTARTSVAAGNSLDLAGRRIIPITTGVSG